MKIYACDFETTVYDGQTNTEVWSSALVELNTDKPLVLHSISDTMAYLESRYEDCLLYYHNFKFDGSFWLDYLIKHTNYKQAFTFFNEDKTAGEWMENNEMPRGSYKYLISKLGQWYSMTIKFESGYVVTFRDSLKLLPYSLKELGKAFKTKHQKLEMEYTGYRYAGCEITKEEMEYIKNDVLVLKEALEFMFEQGHNKMTIGSCCLSEFKNDPFNLWSVTDGDGQPDFRTFFPNLEEVGLDDALFGSENVDRYIRNSYRGGWCYLVPEKANKVYKNGHTADVNSLYPSVMHSDSGSKYPIGEGTFWKGNCIPKEALKEDRYYFVRFTCRFYLKKGMLPFVHIRDKKIYDGNENLTTSDYRDRETGEYHTHYRDKNGVLRSTNVVLTMTCTDYELFLEHYNVEEFEILDGVYFKALSGLFDNYINKWAEIKMNSTGAMRGISKLFLNNLYGKFASSTDSTFKLAYVDEKGIHFREIKANDKEIGYIPIGSAITSYARNFTIRTAQKNYHGANERGFIYADTDSIHCDLAVEEFIDVPTHPTKFNHWKIECTWDEAIFVRQKTYIEHVTEADLEPVEKPYYLVKCAGMPKRCKDLFVWSMEQNYTEKDLKKMTPEGREFVAVKRKLTDFKVKLKVPEKLMPKRIDGGVLLVNTYYEMRDI